MKANMKRNPLRVSGLVAPLGVFLATCLALPASAATSFPNYPLQTGTDSIPPNIMFILDDSGSMVFQTMPHDSYNSGMSNNIYDRSATHNTIYYKPGTTYEPWYGPEGRLSGGTTYDAVYPDLSKVGGTTINLGDSNSCATVNENGNDIWVCGGTQTYYVLKPGSTDTGQNTSFFRYQIRHVDDDGVNGVRVVRSSYLIAAVGNQGVQGAGCGVNQDELGKYRWRDCTFVTPSGATGAEAEAREIANYATWYSYHRTRMKVAKAGASEAFYAVGTNNRVGYDSIWNRLGGSSVPGDRPAYPIPVNGNDEGLFKGDNRDEWFSTLHGAIGQSGTPLHGALQRAGAYFEETGSDGPWGPQSGTAQLSCRQNFAILTSDGYWNSSSGYTSGTIGNADGTDGASIKSADGEKTYQYDADSDGARKYRDGFSNTLADVAMHYWKRDLRGDLPNNVGTSALNPAFWQHMVTFGISIGLKGTLDPQSDVDDIAAGDASWPNPWRTDSSSQDSWGNESARRIDDLLHASVNGRGDFVAANDPAQFGEALKGALHAINKRKSSGSNVTSNGPQLNTGSRIFQATFTSGEWSGDVLSIALSATGGIGSSAWSMAGVIDDDPAAFLGRGVYTWNRDTADGAVFPTTAQTAALERTGGLAPVTGAQNADYIKGYRTREGGAGKLRVRTTPVGDIVNSSPFYSEEAAALFIGANDGMLHAINSNSGAVEFSYVPAGLDFSALSTLSDPEYIHHFFVDGGIDVTTRAQGGNRNILVGSLGRGGKGVFALDVSDPSTFDDSDVLWDKTTTTDGDMGYVLGAPLVRKGRGGTTYAFVGNGIESANGSSALFVYNAVTGTLVEKIVVDANGGGLAPPRAADTNLDGIADTIYAGDLSGALWKFDITGNTNQWAGVKIFSAVDAAGNAQPITAPVAIAREPVTDRIFVMFGTGRYISVDDITSSATQTMYALIDDGNAIAGRAALEQRSIPRTGVDSKGRPARSWEGYSPLPAGVDGWFIDLGIPTAGERVVTGGFMRGRALWFSSIIPEVGAGCDAAGRGYLNAIDAFTGTSPQSGTGDGSGTYMDVDGDGEGDDTVNGEGGGDDDGFVGSVDLGLGMPGQGTGVGNDVYVCGSDAKCGSMDETPGDSAARRLGWRELFNRN